MLKTTANKITLLRIILIPVWLILAYRGLAIPALIVYIIACLSDMLDGYIARHYDQITNFGKFMDPLADKLLVMAALIIFVQWGQIPGWAAFVILAREFAVTALRLVAASEGTVISAGMSGKVKTFSSLVILCVMMTPFHSQVLGIPGFTFDVLGTAVMLIVTVWSGGEYFVRHGKLLKMK